MFRIEMLPAGHGDCLLLTYGTSSSPHQVLIDGGPYYAFSHLAQRIDSLAASASTIELFVVTHVDADHIDGAVKLLGAKSEKLMIEDIWFNGWRHLAPPTDDLLGPVHGEMLSALIQHRRVPWNVAFRGSPVAIRDNFTPREVALKGGLTLTLLSPTVDGLSDLRKVWAKELVKAGLEPDSCAAALKKLRQSARLRPPPDLLGDTRPDVPSLAGSPFVGDTSEANASSIAFLAEFEGKRCLFTGDAHPDVLVRSIRKHLQTHNKTKLEVDAVKLSHHGGKGNTSPELLQLLDCRRFLISSNGNSYKHPHQETIARILVHNGPGVDLLFNYRSDENKVWNDQRLKRRHSYKTHYPSGASSGLVIDL